MATLNTSIAKTVLFKIFDYDDLGFVLNYKVDDVNEPLALYAFTFYHKKGNTTVATYTIGASVASTAYLTKSGNSLGIENMLIAVRSAILDSSNHRLIMSVTNPDAETFVHIIFKLDGNKY